MEDGDGFWELVSPGLLVVVGGGEGLGWRWGEKREGSRMGDRLAGGQGPHLDAHGPLHL